MLLGASEVSGYFIHIDAHSEECFFDRVTSGTKMSLMFEVAEGGFLDIDIKVQCQFFILKWKLWPIYMKIIVYILI